MVVYRNVATVMIAAALLQVAVGVLGVALPLAMAQAEWTGIAIGAVMAGYAAGFMAGAFSAPVVIQQLGHIRAFAAFAGGAAAATLVLALAIDFTWWLTARFLFGFVAAGLFAVAESWIADATPSENRGGVISAYQIVGRAGIIGGPFLIALPGIDLVDSFIVAGVFMSLALIPVTATRRGQPATPEGERVSPLRLFHIAPSAAVAAFFAGTINSGGLAFIPIWAESLSPETVGRDSALIMAAVFGVSMITQWPAGKLSDKMDRRFVIAGLVALSAVFASLLAVFPSPGLLWGAVLIGLWGAFALAYYSITIAHAADRSRAEELPAIASGILMVWAGGSILGPVLVGAVFGGPLGARGMFALLAALGFALAALMIWRSRSRKAVTEAEREPFVNLLATSGELAEIEAPDHEPAGAR